MPSNNQWLRVTLLTIIRRLLLFTYLQFEIFTDNQNFFLFLNNYLEKNLMWELTNVLVVEAHVNYRLTLSNDKQENIQELKSYSYWNLRFYISLSKTDFYYY